MTSHTKVRQKRLHNIPDVLVTTVYSYSVWVCPKLQLPSKWLLIPVCHDKQILASSYSTNTKRNAISVSGITILGETYTPLRSIQFNIVAAQVGGFLWQQRDKWFLNQYYDEVIGHVGSEITGEYMEGAGDNMWRIKNGLWDPLVMSHCLHLTHGFTTSFTRAHSHTLPFFLVI